MAALTRRAAVSAIVTSAGAIALAPASAAAGSADSTSWERVLARYRAECIAFDEANAATNDAQALYFERQPERPVFVMEVEGDYGRFGKHVLPVTILHDDLDDPTRRWADEALIAGMRGDLATYRASEAELRRELRMDELESVENVAIGRQADALRILLATPAPHLPALIEKLTILLSEYDDIDGTTSAVLADVRHLAEAGV